MFNSNSLKKYIFIINKIVIMKNTGQIAKNLLKYMAEGERLWKQNN